MPSRSKYHVPSQRRYSVGAVLEQCRIPVLAAKLAQGHLVHRFSRYSLIPHARIAWSADSRKVKLLVHDVEVFEYTTPDKAPSSRLVTIASKASEAGLIARLPQGTVELLGVCKHPSEDKDWWAPDGSFARDGPFPSRGSQVYADENQQAGEFMMCLWCPNKRKRIQMTTGLTYILIGIRQALPLNHF